MKNEIVGHYVKIWQLHGINTLESGLDGKIIAEFDQPKITAKITANPEPFFKHIDASQAIANSSINLLLGNSAEEVYSEMHFESALKQVRAERLESFKNGVFLAITAEAVNPDLLPYTIIENDDFHFCLENTNSSPFSECFQVQERAIIAAIVANLPKQASAEIRSIAGVSYRDHPTTQKPIYSLTLSAGVARGILSSPLTQDRFLRSKEIASTLAAESSLRGVANLLIDSLDRKEANELQRFVLCWAALETFVQVAFTTFYKDRYGEIDVDGEPDKAKKHLIGTALKKLRQMTTRSRVSLRLLAR